jgi:hypothetical protein
VCAAPSVCIVISGSLATQPTPSLRTAPRRSLCASAAAAAAAPPPPPPQRAALRLPPPLVVGHRHHHARVTTCPLAQDCAWILKHSFGYDVRFIGGVCGRLSPLFFYDMRYGKRASCVEQQQKRRGHPLSLFTWCVVVYLIPYFQFPRRPTGTLGVLACDPKNQSTTGGA